MSVTAYVLVKANTGEADRLKRELAKLPDVTDVHIVAGDVDLIVTVEADDPSDVKSVAAGAMSDVAGVERTQTYIALD